MTREKFLFILGIIVIALPNLGFPNFTEKIIFLVLGLGIIIIAYGYYFAKTKKVAKPVRVSKPKSVATLEEPVANPRPQTKEEMTGFTFIKRNGAVPTEDEQR